MEPRTAPNTRLPLSIRSGQCLFLVAFFLSALPLFASSNDDYAQLYTALADAIDQFSGQQHSSVSAIDESVHTKGLTTRIKKILASFTASHPII